LIGLVCCSREILALSEKNSPASDISALRLALSASLGQSTAPAANRGPAPPLRSAESARSSQVQQFNARKSGYVAGVLRRPPDAGGWRVVRSCRSASFI